MKRKRGFCAMTRRESREKAVGYLFEYSMQPELSADEILANAKDEREEEVSEFAEKTFRTALANREAIDDLIAGASENWSFKRISKVTLAVLRLAVCELKFLDEPTPVEIAVNEALELARLYDTDKAIAFVNGVLAKVVK